MEQTTPSVTTHTVSRRLTTFFHAALFVLLHVPAYIRYLSGQALHNALIHIEN